MKKNKTKTLQGLIEQFHRIAMGTQKHESLRHKAFEAYQRYLNAMDCSDKYWNMREHVIKCIEGRVGADGKRTYLYPPVGNLTREEKAVIAGRIADTAVQFTRKEYAGF